MLYLKQGNSLTKQFGTLVCPVPAVCLPLGQFRVTDKRKYGHSWTENPKIYV